MYVCIYTYDYTYIHIYIYTRIYADVVEELAGGRQGPTEERREDGCACVYIV